MTKFVPSLLTVASPLALMSLAATPAQAAGVAAGTLIENTAEASYALGSATVTIESNTVVIQVDEVLDVAVANQAVSQPSQDTAVFAFDLTNTGNGSEEFDLTVNTSVAGNDFEFVVDEIVIDDGDGIYEPGIDAVLPAGSATQAIAAEDGIRIFVIAQIPAGAVEGDESSLELAAEASTGSGTVGTAFAGQGDMGGDAVVGTSTASQGATQSITVSLTQISLRKAATIADPFGGEEAVPGAIITYTITATVTGSQQLAQVHVIDAIPTGTTYQSESVLLDGAPMTDADDTDQSIAGDSGIDVDLGTVDGGQEYVVTFKVAIN